MLFEFTCYPFIQALSISPGTLSRTVFDHIVCSVELLWYSKLTSQTLVVELYKLCNSISCNEQYHLAHVRTVSICRSCSWLPEREKHFFLCPRSRLRIWSRETGLSVSSRVRLFSTLRLNLVLPRGMPPTFLDGVHLFILCLLPREPGFEV